MKFQFNKKYLSIIAAILLISAAYLYMYGKTNQRNFTNNIEKFIANPSGIKLKPEDYAKAGIENVNLKNIAIVNENLKKYIKDEKNFNEVILPNGKKSKIYRYNVANDYKYDFSHSSAVTYSIDINHSSFSIADPNLNSNQKTQLLKINILHNATGKYFAPTVTINYHKKIYNYTFEEGASGIRYLNISDLNLTVPSVIKIKTKFLNIPDQKAQIISFRNTSLKNKKILIVAAHPDDAEIAAYGIYSTYPKNTYVVTITAGDAGPNKFYDQSFKEKKIQYLEKGKRRTWESLTLPNYGGVPFDNIVNLGFFDGELYTMMQYPYTAIASLYIKTKDIMTFRKENSSSLAKGLSGNSSWLSLVKNLEYLIKTIKPDIIVTHYPAIDRHTDHKVASLALFTALKKTGLKNGKLFLYTNHLENSEYWPYGNRGEPISLPPTMPREIYFEGIYSHHVDKKRQMQKLLALESMSDLRYEDGASAFDNYCKNKDIFTCRDFSYFRRAVKMDELFFVVSYKSIYNDRILNSLK